MGTVENAPGGESPRMGGRGWSPLAWYRRGKRERNIGYVRLRAEFEAYREEFDTLVARTDGETSFWKRDATDLLEKIEDALEDERVEDGWRYFHAAQRVETYGLEALDEIDPEANALETRAVVLRTEALDRLGGWRKAAVAELLGADRLDDDVTGDEVRAASKILHDQYESVHLKRYYLQLQFNQLFWLGTIAGFLFVVLSLSPTFFGGTFLQPPFGVVSAEDGAMAQKVVSPGFAVFVGLAGMVGASLFGMVSLQRKRVSTKVAQQITGLWLTWARGLIGAISALVLYFFIQTPFVGDIGGLTPALMIVVGFAAGYSERMVTRAVETVAGATTEPSE
jgi:hypothetical protein